ncbi:tetratricopeptide repeat protein [Thiorhodococcus mannitoliphagus]|uniref:Tetratricopeptide repeat protein n=2 Tax=Thiorhodococcus mannitoliphagus TaxID=329406 RepID=A0A6P1DTQ0_9GAMM|nr:tetratricopeptide repeat protein [Thiorhodococcus mannitoliphagus]
MDRSSRFLVTLATAGALTACAMGPREGPPAPVVRATPRQAPPPAYSPEPEVEKAPAPAPAAPKPKKQGTQVYAYKDPSRVPDPAPEPDAAAAPVAAPEAPAQRQSTGVEPKTTGPETPPSQTAAGVADASGGAAPSTPNEQIVAKADTKPQLPKTAEPAPPPAPPVSKLPESNVAAPDMPPAAAALASQAERQRQAGDYAGAAASLERSLRIAPREAYLWNRLARVRMEQGQSSQAGNLAARSNDLSGDSADMKKDNWRIIAEAKRRAGDMAGATEAEKRAGQD